MPDPRGIQPCQLPVPAPEYLEQCLSRHPDAPVYWVAYSGGLDSTVLLHLCARLAQRQSPRCFKALHIHHGLHPQADVWASHCDETCRGLGIELRTLRVDGRPAPGQSPEESAREARYRALRAALSPGDTVLLAHHLDDQAETVLLQLFRGAGLAGLAGMPSRSELPPGLLLRPLLEMPRALLRDYAEHHGLRWVEDPSNRDVAYDRNFLRNQILPSLHARWPGLDRTLARSAQHCAEALQVLEEAAQARLATVRSPTGDALRLDRLGGLEPGEQRRVLRAWLKDSGFRMPSATVLEHILEQGLRSGPDRNPVVRWSEGETRRYRNALYLFPRLLRFEPSEPLDWPAAEDRVVLPGGNGELRLRTVSTGGVPVSRWRSARVKIGYRRGGETLRLPGRQGAHELRKLFQEAGIPPWIRERVPLIYLDGQLAAVAGYWLSAHVLTAGGSSPGLIPEWRPPPGLLIEPVPGHRHHAEPSVVTDPGPKSAGLIWADPG